MTSGAARDGSGLSHQALFYASTQEYIEHLVPFIENGLARQQRVAAMVPVHNLTTLRKALGATAERVPMVDMTARGRNPGRIMTVLRELADEHPDRHARLIGEPVWARRSAAEYPACAQYEALVNTAFAGRDVTILCPYDTSRLDRDTLADARVTHPVLWENGRRRTSERYAPAKVLDRYNEPLAPGPGAAICQVDAASDLTRARHFAAGHARRIGFSADRVAQLEVLVTELATNSLVHGGGTCRLAVWQEHDSLVCAAHDTGQLTDPLAGRRPAVPGQYGGRGLLLVNQLADLVRIHASPNGTTVQVYLRL